MGGVEASLASKTPHIFGSPNVHVFIKFIDFGCQYQSAFLGFGDQLAPALSLFLLFPGSDIRRECDGCPPLHRKRSTGRPPRRFVICIASTVLRAPCEVVHIVSVHALTSFSQLQTWVFFSRGRLPMPSGVLRPTSSS